jgi:hypothetical protein
MLFYLDHSKLINYSENLQPHHPTWCGTIMLLRDACGTAGGDLVSPPWQHGRLAAPLHVARQRYPAAPRGLAWAKGSCGANDFLGGVIFKIIFLQKFKIKKILSPLTLFPAASFPTSTFSPARLILVGPFKVHNTTAYLVVVR